MKPHPLPGLTLFLMAETGLICMCVCVHMCENTRLGYSVIDLKIEGYRFHLDYRKQQNTKQFDLYCSNGEWKVIKRHLGTAFSFTKLFSTLKTQTRHDCQTCVHPKMWPSSSVTEHCVSCPEQCKGRCLKDGSCCDVFDLSEKCASKCPKNTYKEKNNQCKCRTGYKQYWKQCVPSCNCKNGGTCDQGTRRCKCPKGFRGLNCQKCSSKPGCKNFHFDERRKEYTCEEKSCELKYIKEPPIFSDINCNPYGGNGYSLQCGVKVDRSLMNKVSIN